MNWRLWSLKKKPGGMVLMNGPKTMDDEVDEGE
jgi:hypothetical protein